MKPSIQRFSFLTATLGVLALALTGCGSDSAAGAEDTVPTQSSQQAGPPPEDGNSVTGELAAITGATMQVQDGSKQTAVTISDSAAISAQVAGTSADVVVGSCVMASAEPSDEATSGEESEIFAAAQVTVTPPSADGTCNMGRGGGFSASKNAPEGRPTDMPSGKPADQSDGSTGKDKTEARSGDLPSGVPAEAVMMQAAGGTVTSVTEGSVTVTGTDMDGKETTRTFTLTDSTAVTATVTADASALVVGQCVAAQGTADSSGSIAAESIMISQPGEQGCVRAAREFTRVAPSGQGPGTDSTTAPDDAN